ncbi:MAG TPA: MBL fold metallo-hydrolase [Candidatus Marinimicrobia bacterium]|jgi:phosphoribosyl 1,2-cyclic phosphodiesterase|nr:MBL fold metallo-hydrolase [Candidatus Neomarinimicrobiota bacterium]
MNNIHVDFWGVRGSVPSPGPTTNRYGGNTSCVSITADNKILILDAGTGIRNLGSAIIGQPELEIFVVVTHSHWDHIQGFPFFTPIYQPNRPVHMFPTLHKKNVVLASLIDQMDGAHFPITPDQVPSNFNFVTENPLEFLANNGFQLELVPMNHPGKAFGYKITIDDKIICYFTDNEIDPPYEKSIELDELTNQCKNADILIHDAQYIEADMPLKHGWGHSLISQVTKLGESAEVKNLVYYHHDPERSDDDIDAELEKASKALKENGSSVIPYFAHEGLRLTL